MELVSTCSSQWSPVHYHYDQRSKYIIRTIGSLKNASILPKISHSISVIMAIFDIFLDIILFVLSFHA